VSNSEKAVCARIGINESEYLAQKGRNEAGPLTVRVNPALRDETRPGHRAAMGRFASGIDGRAIIEEARLEHRDSIDDESTNTEDLVAEAREALDDFDVADEQSWRKLAFAAACIQGALERHAPPYANREPYGNAEAERRRRAGNNTL
jgi:hypothetical protein